MNTFSLQPRGSARRVQYPQTTAGSWGDTPDPGDLMPLGLELCGGGVHAGGWPDSSSAAGSPPEGCMWAVLPRGSRTTAPSATCPRDLGGAQASAKAAVLAGILHSTERECFLSPFLVKCVFPGARGPRIGGCTGTTRQKGPAGPQQPRLPGPPAWAPGQVRSDAHLPPGPSQSAQGPQRLAFYSSVNKLSTFIP